MNSTQILISFDTTGSMSPAIGEVRRKAKDAVQKLFSTIDNLEIGIIAHGDYCDEPRAYFHIPFTDNIDNLVKFINDAPNTGGGDSDEFYEYILQRARLDFNWTADNKIMIFIADAMPHPVGYRYGGKTYAIDWRQEAQKLSDIGVNIYAVEALGSRNSKMFYEPLSAYANGKKVDLSQFTDVVETITAISYHKVGKLGEYKTELEKSFRMNRNLAKLLTDLDKEITVSDEYTRKDSSGLIPVSPHRFQRLFVEKDCDIKSFVMTSGARFRIGRGFYQFTKSEMVQEHKEVILRNKVTGDMFTGAEARNFIGLPFGERGKIMPKLFDDYEVYIQSTSANRKLIRNTWFLYEAEYD